MTVRYYIIPYDPAIYRDPDDVPPPEAHTDLRVNITDFNEHLLQRWSEAKVSFWDGWLIPSPNGYDLAGGVIDDDKQILSIELGDNFKELVLWYRSYVPSTYPLYLFKEGYWDSLHLTSETTLEDIANFTGL